MPEACSYNNDVGTRLRRVRPLPDRRPPQQALRGTPVPPDSTHSGVTVHTVTQTQRPRSLRLQPSGYCHVLQDVV
jgi:hypothetical protein